MAPVLQAIERIIREVGCAVVMFHHTNKPSWALDADASSANSRGSGGPVGAADNIFELRPVEATERRPGELRFYLENTDSRVGEPWPKRLVAIRMNARGAKGAISFFEPGSMDAETLKELRSFIPDAEGEALPVEEIRKRSGMGKKPVQSAVTYGLRTGELVRRPKIGGIYRVRIDRTSPTESDPVRPTQIRGLDSIGESEEWRR
jgi:hypothetical protein